MANTVTYNKHDYVVKLRERLNLPVNWADILKVKYSDVRTIVNSRLSTEPADTGGTRGTAATLVDFALTADTLTIDTYRDLFVFVDEADRHQQSYVDQMYMADYQGRKLSERVETAWLAEHASWTNFGVTDLAGGAADDTSVITVSSTNIDDIIRAVKRKIFANNGIEAYIERGLGFVWRAKDWEILEGFAQANGYTMADSALKSGVPMGFHYLGADHYISTSHAANHLYAGVKRSGDLGILRSTWGRVKFIENPLDRSGLGMFARADYGFVWPGGTLAQLNVDINVAT